LEASREDVANLFETVAEGTCASTIIYEFSRSVSALEEESRRAGLGGTLRSSPVKWAVNVFSELSDPRTSASFESS
jgi:hypothetical protein